MEIGNYLIMFGMLAIFIMSAVWFFIRESKRGNKGTVYVANTQQLSRLPEFQKQIKNYRFGLITGTGALTVILLLTAVLSGRVVTATEIAPQQYNRDILLCLDVSTSMSASNEAVMETYLRLIEEFQGERVGMVVWNATAYSQFPFTDDYAFLESQLKEMKSVFNELETNPDNYPYYFFGTMGGPDTSDSSLAGDGLATCAMKFDKQNSEEERFRSIIFATDNQVMGRENISLTQAVTMTEERDIDLYTIVPNPGTTFGNALTEATENGGGKAYPLTNSPSAVVEIVEQINADQISSFPGEKERVIFDNPNVFLSILFFSLPIFIFFAARSRN